MPSSRYALLPIRDVAVFPGMTMPLYVGRPLSKAAIAHALAENQPIVLAAQRDSMDEAPSRSELHDIGTLANIAQNTALADGSFKLLVTGRARVRLGDVTEMAGRLEVETELLADPPSDEAALRAALKNLAEPFAARISPPDATGATGPRSQRAMNAVVTLMQTVLEGPAASVADRIEKLAAALAKRAEV